MNVYDEEGYFKLALGNSIYHSINEESYKECKVGLPMMFYYFLSYKLNSESLHEYIKLHRNGEM
jgi:hypothetical protein